MKIHRMINNIFNNIFPRASIYYLNMNQNLNYAKIKLLKEYILYIYRTTFNPSSPFSFPIIINNIFYYSSRRKK